MQLNASHYCNSTHCQMSYIYIQPVWQVKIWSQLVITYRFNNVVRRTHFTTGMHYRLLQRSQHLSYWHTQMGPANTERGHNHVTSYMENINFNANKERRYSVSIIRTEVYFETWLHTDYFVAGRVNRGVRLDTSGPNWALTATTQYQWKYLVPWTLYIILSIYIATIYRLGLFRYTYPAPCGPGINKRVYITAWRLSTKSWNNWASC